MGATAVFYLNSRIYEYLACNLFERTALFGFDSEFDSSSTEASSY